MVQDEVGRGRAGQVRPLPRAFVMMLLPVALTLVALLLGLGAWAGAYCLPMAALNAVLTKKTTLDSQAAVEKDADDLVRSTCDGPGLVNLGPVRPVNSKSVPGSCEARDRLLPMPDFFAMKGDLYTLDQSGLDAITPMRDTGWTHLRRCGRRR